MEDSRIADGYEQTNVWHIKPAHDSRHPAVFPKELAEKIITSYSFVGDMVLDPFAGIGTTGKAAVKLGWRFILMEQDIRFSNVILEEGKTWQVAISN